MHTVPRLPPALDIGVTGYRRHRQARHTRFLRRGRWRRHFLFEMSNLSPPTSLPPPLSDLSNEQPLARAGGCSSLVPGSGPNQERPAQGSLGRAQRSASSLRECGRGANTRIPPARTRQSLRAPGGRRTSTTASGSGTRRQHRCRADSGPLRSHRIPTRQALRG